MLHNNTVFSRKEHPSSSSFISNACSFHCCRQPLHSFLVTCTTPLYWFGRKITLFFTSTASFITSLFYTSVASAHVHPTQQESNKKRFSCREKLLPSQGSGALKETQQKNNKVVPTLDSAAQDETTVAANQKLVSRKREKKRAEGKVVDKKELLETPFFSQRYPARAISNFSASSCYMSSFLHAFFSSINPIYLSTVLTTSKKFGPYLKDIYDEIHIQDNDNMPFTPLDSTWTYNAALRLHDSGLLEQKPGIHGDPLSIVETLFSDMFQKETMAYTSRGKKCVFQLLPLFEWSIQHIPPNNGSLQSAVDGMYERIKRVGLCSTSSSQWPFFFPVCLSLRGRATYSGYNSNSLVTIPTTLEIDHISLKQEEKKGLQLPAVSSRISLHLRGATLFFGTAASGTSNHYVAVECLWDDNKEIKEWKVFNDKTVTTYSKESQEIATLLATHGDMFFYN